MNESRQNWVRGLAVLAFLASLLAAAFYKYVLFHALVETLSVVCSVCVFAVIWAAWDFVKSPFLRSVAAFSAGSAVLDLAHMLTYQGMAVFPNISANIPTQLWIASRGLQVGVALAGALLPRLTLGKYPVTAAALGLSFLLLALIATGNFPDCYIEGQGLTSFKVITEYVYMGGFLFILLLILRRWRDTDRRVSLSIAGFLGANTMAEFLFTLYAGPHDEWNMLGHFFRLMAAYALYLAVFELGFREPFALLMRDIKERESRILEDKERAELQTEAKSKFLAHMSHEIRTPMNSLVAVVDLLAHTSLDPVQKKYHGLLNASVENILHVVNDVLDFSKLEARKLTLASEAFPIRRRLTECVQAFAARAQQKRLTLTVDFADGFPESALGDQVRLGQVLNNLVSNALKYTDSGFVRAHFSAQRDGESWVVEGRVSDSGIGIPATLLPSLFEPFTQADLASHRRRGGTGLGLAIVHDLVVLMGGNIRAESTEGKGSRFTFTVKVGVV